MGSSSFYRVLLLVGFCAPIFCMLSSNPYNQESSHLPSMKKNPASQVSPSNIRKELQLQATFLDRVKKLYGAKVFSEDFSNAATAQAQINSYVEKETKGKVVDVIQDLDSQTAMVLVNHIFFKANWTQPFSTANTNKSFPFLLSKGTTVHVPMMHQTESFAFGVDKELGCSILQMDYRGDAVAFFVLPGKGTVSLTWTVSTVQTVELAVT